VQVIDIGTFGISCAGGGGIVQTDRDRSRDVEWIDVNLYVINVFV